MKNAVRVLVIIMLSAGMTSCDWIKGLADIEIDTNIEGNLDVVTDASVLKSTNAHGFDESATIDVLNADLEEYEDLIEDYKTQSITLTVLSIDSAGFAVTGVELLAGTEFGISNTMSGGYTWTLNQNWAIDAGFSLSLDAASYDAIDDILSDQVPITVSAVGTCNKGNIHFRLNYDIDVTVVSNPL